MQSADTKIEKKKGKTHPCLGPKHCRKHKHRKTGEKQTSWVREAVFKGKRQKGVLME